MTLPPVNTVQHTAWDRVPLANLSEFARRDPVALAQGGSDDDADLWPAHTACKAEKDAVDAASKAKRDRLVTASWQSEARPPSRFQSRGFRSSPPQHSATRPIVRKADRQ